MGNGYYIVHFRQLAIFSGLEISVFLYFLHRLSVNDVTNKMARFGVQFLMYALPSDLLGSTLEFICMSSKTIFLSSRCLVEVPFDFIMLIS
jgi:hypothetical protein